MASHDDRTDASATGRSAGPIVGPTDAPAVHIMSFNIRRRMPHVRAGHPDSWKLRRPLLRALLRAERPSILGVQEALADQSAFVADSLGPRFASVGRGRNRDGSGERCTLFFDRERFTVVDWEQIALSDTPDVPGSRSWGNMIPRIAVRADLLDAATGRHLRVINTHFDHISVKSRVRSSRLVSDLVSRGDHPAVVMGDFNARPDSCAYRAFVDDGPLHDSWMTAHTRVTPEWATFSNYKRPREGAKRIDWILVSDGVDVQSAAINATRFDGTAPQSAGAPGAAASDHEPVQAVVSVDTPRTDIAAT
ncbi:endonuclease/exonuclease/phosphatase family protein [Marisediminicola sp. LYQ85]|uniref:endonuclease/exonuclease/phosphatase family protein n=1 Tax=Marisediminicola sp. LYQ85 TaxID=3391062 RepID=UPI003983622D